MLQSFLGNIDERGLLTLTPESDGTFTEARDITGVGMIWAVVDTTHLATVQQALQNGERRRALQLLSTYARSLGPVLD